MEYISSDTNVWLDFVEIEKLNLPFQLPYIYIMNDVIFGVKKKLHNTL